VVVNPAWSLAAHPQQAPWILIGGMTGENAAEVTASVWTGCSKIAHIPPSRAQSRDADALADPQLVEVAAEQPFVAQADGQKVQVAPGYSGIPFSITPSQS